MVTFLLAKYCLMLRWHAKKQSKTELRVLPKPCLAHNDVPSGLDPYPANLE